MPPRSKRAARAIAFLAENDPALASLALWCDIHDTDGETRTIDHKILIGSNFLTLPLREQIGILGHHIMHVALRHTARLAGMRRRFGAGFDAKTYNLAADALVNELLETAEHALPRPAVTLTSLLSEVLHEETDAALHRWDADRLYLALRSLDGSGQQRRDAYVLKTAFAPDLEGDPHENVSDTTTEWQAHITRALQTPGAAGRGIGTVLGQVRDLPRVDTPWEVHLRALLAKAVAETPRLSYRRPRTSWIAAETEARRSAGPTPVFQPGQARNRQRARIVVGLDSSGSVNDTMLSLFAAEVAGIARRSGAETHLLCFDEAVYDHAVFEPFRCETILRSMRFGREGGTSFVDVMDAACKLDPSVIVVLSDLDGPFGQPPPYDVIWATPLSSWLSPPFGKVVSLAC